MDNPANFSLMESVRKMNDTVRRARSGEPQVEDYLKVIASDPVAEWFNEILREKTDELLTERQKSDQLAAALRNWYSARHGETHSSESVVAAEQRLVSLLERMEILNR